MGGCSGNWKRMELIIASFSARGSATDLPYGFEGALCGLAIFDAVVRAASAMRSSAFLMLVHQ